ncbi:MAG: tetratricopeptide repeat protein [Bacteroidetes bacterium]|nr:tetratricopeptide repeat protein [Rhodothermia bacterium]MCS7155789.1 tetratricopeptide repeat protein [Bacteroidota bacterium]MCX7906110.1 tetratricopeptide repeat protein [Bacteroidota bacterium]MDW8138238.1 tetratricopeptide repeat protein [Bacteroidota bacterium]MDW8285922.1 tetratricopeptide repeat protein [Bacteroidota bacterium]
MAQPRKNNTPEAPFSVDTTIRHAPLGALWPGLATGLEQADLRDWGALHQHAASYKPEPSTEAEVAQLRIFCALELGLYEEAVLALEAAPAGSIQDRGVRLWLEARLQERRIGPKPGFYAYERAYTVLRHLRRPPWLVLTLDGLGRTAYAQRDYATAAMYYQHALSIARQEGFRPWLQVLTHNVGVSLQHLGGLQEAERYLQESLSLAQEMGEEWAQALSLYHLARLYHERMRYYGLAIPYYECALILFARQGAQELYAQARSGLVRCQQALDALNVAAIVGLLSPEELEARYVRSLVEHFSHTPRPEAYGRSA